MSKKLLIPVLVITIASGSLLSFSSLAHAQSNSRMQKVEQRLQNKLNQEVQQGEITSTQKTAILNEMVTLMNQLPTGSFTSMTTAQKEQTYQTFQNDMKSWAQSQGINPTYIPLGHIKFGQGHKKD